MNLLITQKSTIEVVTIAVAFVDIGFRRRRRRLINDVLA